VNAVAVTPDGKRAVSASWDRTLRVWDLDSGQPIATLTGHEDSVNAVAVTPDGKRVVSASWDRTLRVWDLDSGTCLAVVAMDGALRAVAVAPDGETIVAGDAGGNVYCLRYVEGKTRRDGGSGDSSSTLR
jgi:WD40 repeat protein